LGGHGACLSEPDPGIEPSRRLGLEIVREKLGLGPVDHADGALEERLGKFGAHALFLAGAGLEEEGRDIGVTRTTLIGIVAGRADAKPIKAASSSKREWESWQDIVLAPDLAHLGELGIADMRIVGPATSRRESACQINYR
jgi:hypothetical protein